MQPLIKHSAITQATRKLSASASQSQRLPRLGVDGHGHAQVAGIVLSRIFSEASTPHSDASKEINEIQKQRNAADDDDRMERAGENGNGKSRRDAFASVDEQARAADVARQETVRIQVHSIQIVKEGRAAGSGKVSAVDEVSPLVVLAEREKRASDGQNDDPGVDGVKEAFMKGVPGTKEKKGARLDAEEEARLKVMAQGISIGIGVDVGVKLKRR